MNRLIAQLLAINWRSYSLPIITILSVPGLWMILCLFFSVPPQVILYCIICATVGGGMLGAQLSRWILGQGTFGGGYMLIMVTAILVLPVVMIIHSRMQSPDASDDARTLAAGSSSYVPLTEREHETRRDIGQVKAKQEQQEMSAELAKFKREARKWLNKCCPLGRGGWMLLNYPVEDIGTNARGGFHLLPFNATYLEGDVHLHYALMGDTQDDPDFGWEKHVFIHNGDRRMIVRELAGVDGQDVQLFPLGRGPVSMEVEFDSSPREPASRYSGLLKDFRQPFEGVARHFEKEIRKKPSGTIQGQVTDSIHPGPLVASDYHWSITIFFLPPLGEGRRFDRLLNMDSVSPRIGIAREGIPIWEADSDILEEREFHSEEIEVELGSPLLDGDQFFFSGSGYTMQIAYLLRKNERRAP